jgi:hypothetical protein
VELSDVVLMKGNLIFGEPPEIRYGSPHVITADSDGCLLTPLSFPQSQRLFSRSAFSDLR